MRILLLSNVPPESVGGAEVQARHLAHRWAVAGHEVIVAGHANQPFAKKNLFVIRIPTLRRSRTLRAISYLVATLWILWRSRRDYDVIYSRFLREQSFAASLAKIIFRLRQPLVVCPESAGVHGDARKISLSFLSPVWTKVLGEGITAINMISRRIELEVLNLGFHQKRITRIPNGVILPTIVPDPRPINDKRPLQILFVGRLVEEKGLDILLNAARMVREVRQTFEVRLVGDGLLRPRLEERVQELVLGDCVKFVGALQPDEVAIQLLDADLFVLPSRYEGLPVALLEAIAHGLPAVATRVSGSEEIIDDTIGWLVPVGDAGELARAIGQALDLGRQGLHEMGQRARAKAARNYDIAQVAKRYECLFEELVAGASTAAR